MNPVSESATAKPDKNQDVAPRMSFGSIIGMGSFLAAYIVLVELMLYFTEGDHTLPFAPMDLKESDVLAALAALAAGTIALQVMAQNSTLSPASTMSAYNHRMLIAYLAVGGTAASCTLAISSFVTVVLTNPAQHLAYLLVVVLLAAMNSFIAADAARRILLREFRNSKIRLVAARRVSRHYNKMMVIGQLKEDRLKRTFTCFWQLLALVVLSVSLDIGLTAAAWDYWPANVLASVVTLGVLLPLVRFAGLQWHSPSLTARIAAPVWLLMILVLSSFVIAAVDPQDAMLHQVALLGVPTFLTLLGLLGRRDRSGWIVPAWVPGAFIRASVYTKVRKDAKRAAKELLDAEAALEADRQKDSMPGARSVKNTDWF